MRTRIRNVSSMFARIAGSNAVKERERERERERDFARGLDCMVPILMQLFEPPIGQECSKYLLY